MALHCIPEVLHTEFLAKSIFIQNNERLCIVGFDSKTIWEERREFGALSFYTEPIKIKSVSCSNDFTYIMCEDNSILSYGSNNFGQLGLGDTEYRNVFTKLTSNDSPDVISISCGNDFVLFLTNTNHVYSCGNNRNGQLGTNSKELQSSKLCFISKLALIYKISCQNNKSFCLDCDGNVFVFGDIFGKKPTKIK